MNLLWVDVSASIKTHADLKPGDLFVSACQEDPPKGMLLKGTRVTPEMPWDHPGLAVLRRWDRLEKLPYTVVIRYDDGEGSWVGFVWVDASTAEDIRAEVAIGQARIQCMKDNNWDTLANMTRQMETVCVMQGQCWTEEFE